MLSLVGAFLMQSTAAGALPSLYAALGEGLEGGEAIGPGGSKERKGPPGVVKPHAAVLNQADRERLWSMSEELVGFQYGI